LLVYLASFCVWTKSLVCKDAFTGIPLFRVPSVDSALRVNQKIFSSLSAVQTTTPSRPDGHLSTIPSVRTTCHTVWTPDRPSIICPDDVLSRPDLHCIEKLLCQLASVQTSQQPVWTHLCDRSASESFQVQFKGRLLQPFGRR